MNSEFEKVPEGYKKSELGIVPENWSVMSLGTIGRFKNGINKDGGSFGHGEPFVNLMDVFGKTSIGAVETLGLIDSNDTDKKEYDLRAGDVLFIRSSVKPSGVGLTAVVKEDLVDAVYSGFLIRYRSDPKISTSFKEYCFYGSEFRKRIVAASSVSANTNINQDNLKQLLLAFPDSLEEQTAIANALSDVDALITSLEKLIAKKRAIKTAAMQQLLTGKKRLPPFGTGKHQSSNATNGQAPANPQNNKTTTPGYKQTELGEIPVDWDVKSLLDLCSLKSGATITGDKIDDSSSYPCYGGNGLRGRTKVFTHDGEYALIGRQGALCGNVQYVYGRFFASEHALVATPTKKASLKWLSIYLERMNLNQYSESSAQPGLSAVKLLVLKLITPAKEEQEAIANTLSVMADEIDALENRLNKTQKIKQGMMQELLTGRTRLI